MHFKIFTFCYFKNTDDDISTMLKVEISADAAFIHLRYKLIYLWFLIMIVCLLLCLLFCVDLREQNRFSWCWALDEARSRYTIYLKDVLIFLEMHAAKCLMQIGNMIFFIDNIYDNARYIVCYRTLGTYTYIIGYYNPSIRITA